MKHPVGNRIRWFRKRWDLNIDQLAQKAGVELESLEQIELGVLTPSRVEAHRLAETLCIDAGWLLTGEGAPIGLGKMTEDEQVRAQTGPGTEGLHGFVVTHGGPWYRDDRGRWQVEDELYES